MGKIKSSKTNYATPGPVLGQKEFEKMIEVAEKGSFYTVNAVKAELAKWKAATT